MSIIGSNVLAGASGQAGYNLTNSLRFRSSASARLSRTFGTTGTNNKIQTFSAWVKRGLLSSSTVYRLMGCYDGSSANSTEINFTNDSLKVEFGGAANNALIATQVFRDPSAWYHIVIAIDTTQATAANRVKMYVNGTQVTAFSTANYPAQNAVSQLTSANANNSIGSGWSGFEYFDGYMTEINFIDGQQLTPSSFGETSTTTGTWIPKKYTSTYGTNGFYLNFSDTSAATAAAIGKDSSGNGNNWTPSGISVTAGTTYDAMIDVPTNTSATVGNYCVLNPLSGYGTRTYANANLQFSTSASGAWGAGTLATSSSAKYYFEVIMTSLTGTGVSGEVGIIPTNYGSGASPDLVAYSYLSVNGNKRTPSTYTSYGSSWTTNDVIGVAYDGTNGTITFYKNNVSQGSAATGLTGDFVPYVFLPSSLASVTYSINFGQQPFTYTPPSGYVALNTYNLPTPTILQGNKYMDATLYTGNNTTNVITNAGTFKPDFLWIKTRSAGLYNHHLMNSISGATKALISNGTGAEITDTSVTSFNSNGFSLATDTTYLETNQNGSTYVGWQWQAGQGTTSSDTSGSITSTVSVNTTAGFSIVTYTGTGANATVGHGLGVAPKIVIAKPRTAADHWFTWSSTLALGNTLYLNLTNASTTSTTVWNSTAPTSSIFSVGTALSGNTVTYVAYCWADVSGYSKAFSYTGNGSTDGSFVFLGFLPRFVMIKRTDTTGDWYMWDTARNTYDVITNTLLANSSAAETSATSIDALSNGFKLRNTTAGFNASGGTYIGMAWATNPFKNSNAF